VNLSEEAQILVYVKSEACAALGGRKVRSNLAEDGSRSSLKKKARRTFSDEAGPGLQGLEAAWYAVRCPGMSSEPRNSTWSRSSPPLPSSGAKRDVIFIFVTYTASCGGAATPSRETCQQTASLRGLSGLPLLNISVRDSPVYKQRYLIDVLEYSY
jgi:hypothetical protein